MAFELPLAGYGLPTEQGVPYIGAKDNNNRIAVGAGMYWKNNSGVWVPASVANPIPTRLSDGTDQVQVNSDGSLPVQLTGSIASATILTSAPLAANNSYTSPWLQRTTDMVYLIIETDQPIQVTLQEALSASPSSFDQYSFHAQFDSASGGYRLVIPLFISAPYYRVIVKNIGASTQTVFSVAVSNKFDHFISHYIVTVPWYNVAIRDTLYHSVWSNLLPGISVLRSRNFAPTLFVIKNTLDQSVTVNIGVSSPSYGFNVASNISVAAGATKTISVADTPLLGNLPAVAYEASATAAAAPTTGGLYIYAIAAARR
jgi:hypothetical protein